MKKENEKLNKDEIEAPTSKSAEVESVEATETTSEQVSESSPVGADKTKVAKSNDKLNTESKDPEFKDLGNKGNSVEEAKEVESTTPKVSTSKTDPKPKGFVLAAAPKVASTLDKVEARSTVKDEIAAESAQKRANLYSQVLEASGANEMEITAEKLTDHFLRYNPKKMNPFNVEYKSLKGYNGVKATYPQGLALGEVDKAAFIAASETERDDIAREAGALRSVGGTGQIDVPTGQYLKAGFGIKLDPITYYNVHPTVASKMLSTAATLPLMYALPEFGTKSVGADSAVTTDRKGYIGEVISADDQSIKISDNKNIDNKPSDTGRVYAMVGTTTLASAAVGEAARMNAYPLGTLKHLTTATESIETMDKTPGIGKIYVNDTKKYFNDNHIIDAFSFLSAERSKDKKIFNFEFDAINKADTFIKDFNAYVQSNEIGSTYGMSSMDPKAALATAHFKLFDHTALLANTAVSVASHYNYFLTRSKGMRATRAITSFLDVAALRRTKALLKLWKEDKNFLTWKDAIIDIEDAIVIDKLRNQSVHDQDNTLLDKVIQFQSTLNPHLPEAQYVNYIKPAQRADFDKWSHIHVEYGSMYASILQEKNLFIPQGYTVEKFDNVETVISNGYFLDMTTLTEGGLKGRDDSKFSSNKLSNTFKTAVKGANKGNLVLNWELDTVQSHQGFNTNLPSDFSVNWIKAMSQLKKGWELKTNAIQNGLLFAWDAVFADMTRTAYTNDVIHPTQLLDTIIAQLDDMIKWFSALTQDSNGLTVKARKYKLIDTAEALEKRARYIGDSDQAARIKNFFDSVPFIEAWEATDTLASNITRKKTLMLVNSNLSREHLALDPEMYSGTNGKGNLYKSQQYTDVMTLRRKGIETVKVIDPRNGGIDTLRLVAENADQIKDSKLIEVNNKMWNEATWTQTDYDDYLKKYLIIKPSSALVPMLVGSYAKLGDDLMRLISIDKTAGTQIQIDFLQFSAEIKGHNKRMVIPMQMEFMPKENAQLKDLHAELETWELQVNRGEGYVPYPSYKLDVDQMISLKLSIPTWAEVVSGFGLFEAFTNKVETFKSRRIETMVDTILNIYPDFPLQMTIADEVEVPFRIFDELWNYNVVAVMDKESLFGESQDNFAENPAEVTLTADEAVSVITL